MVDYKMRRSTLKRSERILIMTDSEFNACPVEARGFTDNSAWVIRGNTVFNVTLIDRHVHLPLFFRSPAPCSAAA